MSIRGFAVTIQIPVLWSDMDALKHVNNTRYFTWLESARIAYFSRVAGHLGPDVGPILASTTCDYLRPIVFPADVLIGVKVSEIGTSSLRMEYLVTRSDNTEEPCAKGSSVVVLVRYSTLEKVRVPDDVRATIAALEKQAAKAG